MVHWARAGDHELYPDFGGGVREGLRKAIKNEAIYFVYSEQARI